VVMIGVDKNDVIALAAAAQFGKARLDIPRRGSEFDRRSVVELIARIINEPVNLREPCRVKQRKNTGGRWRAYLEIGGVAVETGQYAHDLHLPEFHSAPPQPDDTRL